MRALKRFRSVRTPEGRAGGDLADSFAANVQDRASVVIYSEKRLMKARPPIPTARTDGPPSSLSCTSCPGSKRAALVNERRPPVGRRSVVVGRYVMTCT
jgi:hypothetical protein